jgi:hypothetical protein
MACLSVDLTVVVAQVAQVRQQLSVRILNATKLVEKPGGVDQSMPVLVFGTLKPVSLRVPLRGAARYSTNEMRANSTDDRRGS